MYEVYFMYLSTLIPTYSDADIAAFLLLQVYMAGAHGSIVG
jgi:hypothetical protein